MNSCSRPLMTVAILASTLAIFTPSSIAQYKQVNLDTNTAGTGKYLDPLIVNAWGVGYRDGGPFWVTDEGAGVVTIYDQRGEKANLVVVVPPRAFQRGRWAHPQDWWSILLQTSSSQRTASPDRRFSSSTPWMELSAAGIRTSISITPSSW